MLFLQNAHRETEAPRGKETPSHPAAPAPVCIAREPWLGSGPGPMLSPILLCSPGVPRGCSGDYAPPLLWPHLTWSLFAASSVALPGIILNKQGQPPGSRQLTRFRCPGRTTSRQADAQMLTLIADAWPVVMAQRGDFLFPSQVANSGLGCSKFQGLVPETLVREATSRKSEEKEKEKEKADKAGGQMHFDHLGTYFFFFQNFSGSRTGLSSKSQQGGGKRG